MSNPTPDLITAAVQARRQDLEHLLLTLVQTSSVTGNEGAVQAIIANRLGEIGLHVESFLSSREEMVDYLMHVGEQASYENRPSIVANLPGKGNGKSLMLAGHVDTVPVEDRSKWSRSPEGEIVGNLLYGLGSTDMKGGVAAAMLVPQILADLGVTLNGDLMVNTTTGEEDGGLGTMSTILHGYKADGIVITEPTDGAVKIASGGSLVFRITVHGKAAHGGQRNSGVSALEKFVPIFQDLLAWEAERQITVSHPLYDHFENKFPISVGMVRAGNWASTVPDHLVAEGRLGFLPGETIEGMMQQTRDRIAAVADADDWMREHPPVVEFFGGQFTAEEISPDHELVTATLQAHQTVTGAEAPVSALTAGTDQRLWVHFTDCPALLYCGAGFDLAHQSDECVDLDKVAETVAVLTQLAMDWCGVASAES